MLYDTTTYYNLQAIRRNTTRRAWASTGRECVGIEIGLVRAVAAFSGVGGTLPLPSPVLGFLGAPARPGCGSGPSSSGMAMLAAPGRWPFFLAFNLRPSQLAAAVEVGHGLGKPLFTAKPFFAAFQRGVALDKGAGGGVATGAACRALLSSLAVGQHDCRRGSRRSRGNPAGVPRRRRRPTP